MTGSTHHADYRLFLAVLKDARKLQGITQVQLAFRLENTQTFVSKCERGERRIDLVEFVEFAEALGLKPDAILATYLGRRATTTSSRKAAKARKGKE